MNKAKICFWLSLVLGLLSFTSCDQDAHKDESGLAVSLNIPPGDLVGSVQLWIYQEDGTFVKEYTYSDIREMAKDRFQLPEGDYVLVAANNLVSPFYVSQMEGCGEKSYDCLFFGLTDSLSTSHAHYGVQSVRIENREATWTEIKMNRILVELQVVVNDVPENLVSAEVYVKNTAIGFFPARNKFSQSVARVSLGKVKKQDGRIVFPLKRLMPVTNSDSVISGTNTLSTLLEFVFYYSDGSQIEFEASAPVIENGGTYTLEMKYAEFRPGITLILTGINRWSVGGNTGGEILNPDR